MHGVHLDWETPIPVEFNPQIRSSDRLDRDGSHSHPTEPSQAAARPQAAATASTG
jgi:hypothetical protein